MASRKKKQKITIRQALAGALWDTLEVAMYSGIPATGAIVMVDMVSNDIPYIAKYAPYIASLINIIVFYIRRTILYIKGERELPEFLENK